MNIFDKRVIGVGGCGLLIVGCFLPMLKFPSITYWNDGRGDGVLVVPLAVITAVLLLARWNKLAVVTGLAASGVVGYFLYNVFTGLTGIVRVENLLDIGAFTLGLGAILAVVAILLPSGAQATKEILQPITPMTPMPGADQASDSYAVGVFAGKAIRQSFSTEAIISIIITSVILFGIVFVIHSGADGGGRSVDSNTYISIGGLVVVVSALLNWLIIVPLLRRFRN